MDQSGAAGDKSTERSCRDTSAIVKILYISGKITGATNGICVSVTSRVNSARQKRSRWVIIIDADSLHLYLTTHL